METSKDLLTLCSAFKKAGGRLLMVGGCVRDDILKKEYCDIDLAGNLDTKKVEELLKTIKFSCSEINPRLGTTQIKSPSGEKYEYTTFRRDSYNGSGNHTPKSVEFVSTEQEDALRRDFKVNAIYYDPLTDTIIDPLNGMQDIKDGVISTCLSPSVTLSEDALRILRAFRFEAKLDFKISRDTLKEIKILVPLLKSISKERVLEELKMVLGSKSITASMASRYITRIVSSGATKYLFSSSISSNFKIPKKDIISTASLPENIRLVGFFVSVLKNHITKKISADHLMFTVNSILGHSGIKASKDEITCTQKLLSIYYHLTSASDKLTPSINYLTLSTPERMVIDCNINKSAKTALSDNISLVHDRNLPLSVHELDVSPSELIDAGIQQVYISRLLGTLYNMVLNFTVENKKEELIKTALQINSTMLKIKNENENRKNKGAKLK